MFKYYVTLGFDRYTHKVQISGSEYHRIEGLNMRNVDLIRNGINTVNGRFQYDINRVFFIEITKEYD